MFITQTDLANKNIQIGAITANSQALLDLIKEHSNSDAVTAMRDGANYYRVENTAVNDTEFNQYNVYEFAGNDSSNNPTYTATTKTNLHSKNIKKPSPLYRGGIIQKIDYGLSNGVVIEYPDDTTKDNIIDTLGKTLDVKLSSLATEGANSAVSYLYVYVDKDGQFKYTVMDSKELIIIYEDDTREEISQVIRYYSVQDITDGKTTSKWIIELYGSEGKEVFEEQSGGLLVSQGVSAYGLIKTTDNEVEIPINWGKPPFVEYINNPERITDLQPVKSQIDDIDIQDSQLSNDFIDKPESLINIHGFEGDNPANLLEFLKVMGVTFTAGDDSAITGIEVKIPYEGKQSVIDATTKNAYKAMQAVDTSTETISKASSGVALEIMYKPLNSKVLRMYQGLTKSLYSLLSFVNIYYTLASKITGAKSMPTFDPTQASFVFTPDVVVNLTEIVEAAVKLSAIGYPIEKILDILPMVDSNNKQEILDLIEEQKVDLFQEPMAEDDT